MCPGVDISNRTPSAFNNCSTKVFGENRLDN